LPRSTKGKIVTLPCTYSTALGRGTASFGWSDVASQRVQRFFVENDFLYDREAPNLASFTYIELMKLHRSFANPTLLALHISLKHLRRGEASEDVRNPIKMLTEQRIFVLSWHLDQGVSDWKLSKMTNGLKALWLLTSCTLRNEESHTS